MKPAQSGRLSGRTLIGFDPRIVISIDAWAKQRGINRSTLIRDIIYTAVHQHIRGTEPLLKRAPRYNAPMGAGYGHLGHIRSIETGPGLYSYCEVDEHGLLTEPIG
jgi:hypothetical protein